MRVQLQLTKLFNDDSSSYSNPGVINGVWGSVPTNSSSVTSNRKAIYNFKKKHGYLVNETGFSASDYDLTKSESAYIKLNNVAEICEVG